MKLHKRILALLTAGLLVLALCPMSVSAKSNTDTLAQAKKAVVQIYLWATDGLRWSSWVGTGFAVGTEGEDSDVFVTNWHVVTPPDTFGYASEIWIVQEGCTFDENGRPDPAKSISCKVLKTTSGYPDYAIVRATESVSGYKALPLISSDQVPDGSNVYALGYPAAISERSASHFGIDDITVTNGIVSQHMELVDAGNTKALLHTAQISGGNSGGPLITENGAVVGVNTYTSNELDGTGERYYAVDSCYVMDALDSLGIHYDLYQDTEDGTEAGTENGNLGMAEGPFTLLVLFGLALVVCAIVAGLVVVKTREKNKPAPQPVYTPPVNTPPAYTSSVPSSTPTASGASCQPAPPPRSAAPTSPVSPPAAQKQRICLRTSNGKTFTVTGSATFGRNPQCKVSLPENAPGVSRVHCRVDLKGDVLMLTDLGSSYGTFAGGRKIVPNAPVALKQGDSFSLGSEKYVFVYCGLQQ